MESPLPIRNFVEQKILNHLETESLNSSQIRESVFQRHRKINEINEALLRLEEENLIVEIEVSPDVYAWSLPGKAPVQTEKIPEPIATDQGPTPEKETHEHTSGSWKIDIDGPRVKSLDDLIEHCKVDRSIWEVKKCKITTYEMTAMPRSVGDGNSGWRRPNSTPITVPMWSVKAEFEKKHHIVAAKQELRFLKEDAPKIFVPEPFCIVAPLHKSGNMLEIDMPDLHMGKLAWSKETGWEDYDTNLAEKAHDMAFENTIKRSSHYKFDCIQIVVGNDLLNSDNTQGTTTRGTPQDSDSRFQKTFRVARTMIARMINRCRDLAPEVKVVMVRGNHDDLSVWHLGDSLECLFENCSDVVISNDPTPRKYTQWGRVLLGYCHGNEAKRADLPLLMAVEEPRMFAQSFYREIHVGHLHQENVWEKQGIKVRILSSLSAADDYHARNGYVGNLRQAQGFIWNNNDGLLGITTYTLPLDEKILRKAA